MEVNIAYPAPLELVGGSCVLDLTPCNCILWKRVEGLPVRCHAHDQFKWELYQGTQ